MPQLQILPRQEPTMFADGYILHLIVSGDRQNNIDLIDSADKEEITYRMNQTCEQARYGVRVVAQDLPFRGQYFITKKMIHAPKLELPKDSGELKTLYEALEYHIKNAERWNFAATCLQMTRRIKVQYTLIPFRSEDVQVEIVDHMRFYLKDMLTVLKGEKTATGFKGKTGKAFENHFKFYTYNMHELVIGNLSTQIAHYTKLMREAYNARRRSNLAPNELNTLEKLYLNIESQLKEI